MKFCDDCKYATWQRTTAGRLHPSRDGKCTFETDVQLPNSAGYTWWRVSKGNVLEVRGDYIQRKREHKYDCPYFARLP